MTNAQPHPIDLHVGRQIRLRRKLLGLSQTTLGQRLGITFQQIQKYERGFSRVSASRLWELAEALDVPMTFFFDGAPQAPGQGAFTPMEIPRLSDADRRDLLEHLDQIRSPKVRQSVLALARTLATTF